MIEAKENTKFKNTLSMLYQLNERLAVKLKNTTHNITITDTNNIVLEFNKNALNNMSLTLQDISDLQFAIRACVGYQYTLNIPAELVQNIIKNEALGRLKALEEQFQ